MLSPTLATVRLTLHVLAATIWVGGQFILAGLLPVLRQHEGSAKQAARAFNRIAWPAFFVLTVTGIWNLTAVDITNTSNAYQVTVLFKVAIAMLAGMGAAAHSFGTGKLALAVGGAVSALASVAAVFLGVLLHTGR
jgi:uncharacterized membrane protein